MQYIHCYQKFYKILKQYTNNVKLKKKNFLGSMLSRIYLFYLYIN